jgi:hypothetical protein
MPEADELTEYLRGESALSRQYQREAPPLPPHSLDRAVFDAAREQVKPMPQTARERNPVTWLEDIAALRRTGRDDEADVEMRRFRSAYPNYIIPLNE